MARKYGKKASKKVERAMRKRKQGTLRSGRSGKKVKSREQAIAIGLSEAREAGAKVPSRGGKKSSRKKSGGRKTSSSARSSSGGGRKKSSGARKKDGRRKKSSSSSSS